MKSWPPITLNHWGTTMMADFDTPYLAGYDCGENGPDTVNSNFKWFSSADSTRSWEQGKLAAESKVKAKE